MACTPIVRSSAFPRSRSGSRGCLCWSPKQSAVEECERRDFMSPPSAPIRDNSGVLSVVEQRALHWLAPRVPSKVGPDHLTALGFGGAVIALLGYWLAARCPLALWLVNVGLVINWLGDSLDGSIARLRGAERPRYGFF